MSKRGEERCTYLASREQNEFSAKKAYADCSKTVESELKREDAMERERRLAEERRINQTKQALARVVELCKQRAPEWVALQAERTDSRFNDYKAQYDESMREYGELREDVYPAIAWYRDWLRRGSQHIDAILKTEPLLYKNSDQVFLPEDGFRDCKPDYLQMISNPK